MKCKLCGTTIDRNFSGTVVLIKGVAICPGCQAEIKASEVKIPAKSIPKTEAQIPVESKQEQKQTTKTEPAPEPEKPAEDSDDVFEDEDTL